MISQVSNTHINMGVDQYACFMQIFIYCYYCNNPKQCQNYQKHNILENNLKDTACFKNMLKALHGKLKANRQQQMGTDLNETFLSNTYTMWCPTTLVKVN